MENSRHLGELIEACACTDPSTVC